MPQLSQTMYMIGCLSTNSLYLFISGGGTNTPMPCQKDGSRGIDPQNFWSALHVVLRQTVIVSNLLYLDMNAEKIQVGHPNVYHSILLSKNQNFLSCLKMYCLPCLLHSSPFFLSFTGT